MQQLAQKLSNGELAVQDLPEPIMGEGMLLIKNKYSLISAGTEGSTAQAARKSLLGKAKERPQQVKQVLDVMARQGPLQAYRAVTKKLEAYSPLGYSSAGEVIDVGDNVTDFKTGDYVACAGVGYANHAEIVAVPVNLCVKLKKDTDLKNAAYNTLGAIAMQSVRQADLRLGENCAVIGLGLLGQLTCLILKASGVRVVGVDVNAFAVETAASHSADLALLRSTPGIEESISNFTGGLGVDSVIIAAATDSTDPINFAGAIARKKGRVVLLGAVPPSFDRDPYWYRKELELKMSCSYGPGRYDLNYEEKGVDYPPAYVRWTEKRNMEAFQQLLADGRIDIGYLTTHEFDLVDAPKAYDMIVDKTEPYLGIIIKYDTDKPVEKIKKIIVSQPVAEREINIAFIGAGSYAQGNLLPNLPKWANITRKGVLTNTGTTSKRVAERFHFEFCTSNEDDIIKSESVNTIFIATRHDSHAEYVIKSLSAGKHVFVEKPLCLTGDELDRITDIKAATPDKQLCVGFNRRFSSLSVFLKKQIGTGPMTMLYRVNAGKIPADTWIQDMELGGGRIIGEACHFIDYLTWFNGSLPVSVYAAALPDPEAKNDTVNINLTFENGSTGVVAYYANGPKSMPKEYFEVFKSGVAGVIDNFKRAEFYGRKKMKKSLLNQGKGQKQMVEGFLKSIHEGNDLIPFDEIVSVTKTTFAVLESLRTGLPIKI
ncbi:MAG TPA: bi-domain-containing oxidoreductase [Bacteroidales bacterium]|nr:bi-domain-containing oxidoreductase [Bacteroidales bacterium]